MLAPMHRTARERLRRGDALLVVDVQPDFCPGGALPVPEGDRVVPVLNAWIDAAQAVRVPVVASRDWHPPDHVSFRSRGGPWPPHCVQDTPGAAYHPALALPPDAVRVAKGTRLDRDQSSAFDETGLAVHLRALHVGRLFVGGLAQDVCVRASVLDALRDGFAVRVIVQATRPVEAAVGAAALRELEAAGAVLEAD
jgi:nicotinamidase/pyrazinamidase